MKKRYLLLLLIIWGLVAFIISSYLWSENKRLKQANQILLETTLTSRDFAKNSNEAYRTIGICIADYSKCNPQEVKTKVLSLDAQNDELWSLLQQYDQKLQSLKILK